MSAIEELLQAALMAPDDRKAQALRVLRGEASPTPAVPVVEPYIRLRELSERLGISVVSLWRWDVPGHDLGGRRRFRMSEVQAYLESDVFKAKVEELKAARKEVAGKSA